MAHTVCRTLDTWIVEEVSRRVEGWVEEQRQECRQQACNWICLCCNKWWCFFVSVIVAFAWWVLEKIVRLVTRTFCEFFASVVDIVVNVVAGVVGFVAAIARGNWSGAVDALSRLLLDGIVKPQVDLFRISVFGDAADLVREEINEARLKAHVRALLATRYGDNVSVQAEIARAIALDRGAFGLRLRCRVVRLFLDSAADRDASGVPAIIRWHEAGLIDLRVLAGVTQVPVSRAFRPELPDVSANLVVGSTLDTDPVPEITPAQLTAYIEARGIAAALPPGFRFRIVGCSRATLATKTEVATMMARALGLQLTWEVSDVAATKPTHVLHPGDRAGNRDILVGLLGRHEASGHPAEAVSDLCRPTCALTIFYANCLSASGTCTRGLSSVLATPAPCTAAEDNLTGDGFSGVTFRDNVSDFVMKYVLVHELGHYFGLCHANGVDRIMYTNASKSILSWSLIPELYLSAEPRFTIEEAMRAWDYIVANFNTGCLRFREG